MNDTSRRPYPPLTCTACGAQVSPLLEYTGHAYSEHRDHTGYECDECPATWDKWGAPTSAPSVEQPYDDLCANCGGKIVEKPYGPYPWLHIGGWRFCPWQPETDKPTVVATPSGKGS